MTFCDVYPPENEGFPFAVEPTCYTHILSGNLVSPNGSNGNIVLKSIWRPCQCGHWGEFYDFTNVDNIDGYAWGHPDIIVHMEVYQNRGTPKSSILMGFSIIL